MKATKTSKHRRSFCGYSPSDIEEKVSGSEQENAGTVFNIEKHAIDHKPLMQPPRAIGEPRTIYKAYSMLAEYETKPKPRRR
jgi:hypothetical protein